MNPFTVALLNNRAVDDHVKDMRARGLRLMDPPQVDEEESGHVLEWMANTIKSMDNYEHPFTINDPLMRSLSPQQRRLFPQMARSGPDPISAHSRHQFWESAVEKAEAKGLDSTPFRMQLARALCELNEYNQALAIADQHVDVEEIDPIFCNAMDNLRGLALLFKHQIHNSYLDLKKRRYEARDPPESLDEYLDCAEPQRRADVVAHVLDEQLDAHSARIDEIARLGTSAIAGAVAKDLKVHRSALEPYFASCASPREAAELAFALRIINTHPESRNGRIVPLGCSKIKEVVGVIKAHKIVAELSGKLAVGAASPEDVITAMKECHTLLTCSQRYYFPRDPHTGEVMLDKPLILIGGLFRNCPITAGRLLFPFHDRIPGMMNSAAEKLIELTGKNSDASPLLVAAWLHHTIAMIHPFRDGNGRVARFMSSLPLMARGKGVACYDRSLGYDNACEAIEGLDDYDSYDFQSEEYYQSSPRRSLPLIETLLSSGEKITASLKSLCEKSLVRMTFGSLMSRALPSIGSDLITTNSNEPEDKSAADRLNRLMDAFNANMVAEAAHSMHQFSLPAADIKITDPSPRSVKKKSKMVLNPLQKANVLDAAGFRDFFHKMASNQVVKL